MTDNPITNTDVPSNTLDLNKIQTTPVEATTIDTDLPKRFEISSPLKNPNEIFKDSDCKSPNEISNSPILDQDNYNSQHYMAEVDTVNYIHDKIAIGSKTPLSYIPEVESLSVDDFKQLIVQKNQFQHILYDMTQDMRIILRKITMPKAVYFFGSKIIGGRV